MQCSTNFLTCGAAPPQAVDVPLLEATDENLKGFGYLKSHFEPGGVTVLKRNALTPPRVVRQVCAAQPG